MKNPFTYFKRKREYKKRLQEFALFEFRPGTHGLKWYKFYLNGNARKSIPTKNCLRELVLLQALIVKYDKIMDESFELDYEDLTWNKIPQTQSHNN